MWPFCLREMFLPSNIRLTASAWTVQQQLIIMLPDDIVAMLQLW